MTAPDERLERVFLAALEAPPDEREATVRQLAGDDDALCAEALALLQAHDGIGRFDEIALELGMRATDDEREPSADALLGRRIGPYILERLLGHGGMGSVYLAERADGQFAQRVAIKLHRTDRAIGDPHGRLLAERQILARLSHPNIARLFDGGVSDDGRPYFVMEYVEGNPLDRHCDANKLGLADRLRLFITVCEAVQYAHRNLVIHRDLKPSNILVAADGSVKLLDFGIAKLVESEDTTPGGVTAAGLRAMTPDYASPEQASGRPVSTASDVYQLGLVLYELLTGRRAVRLTSNSPAEVEQVVSAGIGQRPSDAVARDGDAPTAEALAASRGTTPEKLRRQLAGDLDSIVLTAARPEPESRYDSATDLASDIRRHLEGRTVRARTATSWYRASRFVRRNPVGLVAAAAIVLLTAGYAVSLARESRRTALERDRAEQVTRFLSEIFASADPEVARGATLTARELIDRGSMRIRRELEGDEELRARLMSVIARAYEGLEVFDSALALRQEVLAIARRRNPPDDGDLARAVTAVATALIRRGDFGSAPPLLEEAESLVRRSGQSGFERSLALGNIGFAWQAIGSLDRAEPLLEEDLHARRLQRDSSDAIATPLSNLGMLRLARGDADSAVALLREGLGIRRRVLDADHPEIATSLENLATALVRSGNLAAADSAVQDAQRITRIVFPPGHTRNAVLLHSRAGILKSRRDGAESERLYRQSLDLMLARHGDRHPFVGQIRNDLGTLLKETGRLPEAEALYRQALEVYRQQFGPRHSSTAIVQANLAWVISLQRRFGEADSLYGEIAPVLRAAAPTRPSTGTILIDFGMVRSNAGNAAGAALLLQEALGILLGSVGENDDRTLRARNMLGLSLVQLKRFDEAEAQLMASYRTASARKAGDPAIGWAGFSLARLYDAWGRPREAERFRALAPK